MPATARVRIAAKLARTMAADPAQLARLIRREGAIDRIAIGMMTATAGAMRSRTRNQVDAKLSAREQHHDVEDDPPAAAELARRQTRDEDAWFR